MLPVSKYAKGQELLTPYYLFLLDIPCNDISGDFPQWFCPVIEGIEESDCLADQLLLDLFGL